MIKSLCLILLTIFILKSNASPARDRGSGKYIADNSSGKYIENHDKWTYKHDNRGKYVHVPVPYNGGYGPFKNPYDHDGRPYEHDGRPYDHDEKKLNELFGVQVFTDKTPSVYREYGAPLFSSNFK